MRNGHPTQRSPFLDYYAELWILTVSEKTAGWAAHVEAEIILNQAVMTESSERQRQRLDAAIAEELDLDLEYRKLLLNPNPDPIALADIAKAKATRLIEIAARLRTLEGKDEA